MINTAMYRRVWRISMGGGIDEWSIAMLNCMAFRVRRKCAITEYYTLARRHGYQNKRHLSNGDTQATIQTCLMYVRKGSCDLMHVTSW